MSGFNLWQAGVDLTGELYHHVVCCHRISLLLVSMETFSITSKCCFRGLFTLPKTISWGNTEMLLCTYCIGQSPKMGKGNRFLESWQGSGHDYHFGIVRSWQRDWITSPLLLSLCIRVFVSLPQGNGKFRIPVGANASWVSSHLPLPGSLSFSCPCLCFPPLPFSLSACLNQGGVWWWIFNMAAS